MHEVSEIKLEALHGCEYHSLTYEGVVGINRQNVYRNGEIIDQLDTNEKVKIAWNEFLDDNGY